MRIKRLLHDFLDGRNIVLVACMLVVCVCLLSARSVSVSQIWRGYRVLYVPVSVPEESVLAVLSEAGCSGVISLSAQRVPLSTKFFGTLLGSSGYLEDRLRYFRDADGDYRLFYIPEDYEKESEAAVGRLVREQHLNAGLDAKERYPFMIPLVVFALYGFLLVVSLKRPYFALPALFPLLLAFSRPFYAVACGCCFLLFALFLANRIWGRKGAVSSIFKNIYVDVLLLVSLLLFLAQSPACFALALLAAFASVCAVLFLLELKVIKDRNSSFSYSLIFMARQIPILYGRTARYLLCLILPLFSFLLIFLFSAKFSASRSLSGIRMPTPALRSSTEPSDSSPLSLSAEAVPLDSAALPNAEDYFRWAWGIIAYPYMNLNDFASLARGPVQEGDKIVLPRYEENDRGIKRKDEVVLTYNNSFRRDMEKAVAGLDYPAIEKLLKAQDRDVLVMYSATAARSGKKSDVFNLLSIVLSLLVPVILSAAFHSVNRSRS